MESRRSTSSSSSLPEPKVVVVSNEQKTNEGVVGADGNINQG